MFKQTLQLFLITSFAATAIAIPTDEPTRSLSAKEIATMKLSSSLLPVIDGRTGLMDEHKIKAINYMLQELVKIQFGVFDKGTNTWKGKYEFQGQWYSAKKFVKIEQELFEKCAHLDQESSEYKTAMEPWNKAFQEAQIDFEKTTDPFLALARGLQEFIIPLIAEACQKMHRPDSLLLDWSKSMKHEKESFRKNITSFQVLDTFCTDLINFLRILKNNCPKAVQRYENSKAGTRK